MSEEQLREWLRENLVIDVSEAFPREGGNSVYVGLRFKHELDCFHREYLYIPKERP